MRPHPETHPIKEKQRAVVLEAPPKPGLLSLSGVGQGPRAQCYNGPGVGGRCHFATGPGRLYPWEESSQPQGD